MSEFTRRRLLAASGAVAMGAVAGCMGSGNEPEDDADADENDAGDGGDGGDDGDIGDGPSDNETAEESESSTAGTALQSISVENLASEAHTVDVIVEFGDGIESWTTHELEPRDGEDLDRNWPTESSDFRVQARLDGEAVSEVRPATWNDPDCLALTVVVDRTNELAIWSAAGEDVCSVR